MTAAAGQTGSVLLGLSLSYSGGYSEGVMRGIANFAQRRPEWTFELQPPNSEGISKLLSAGAAGLIVNGLTEALDPALARVALPIVNVGSPLSNHRISTVTNDQEAIGELAAAHFLLRGYRAFGYCTQTGGELDGRLVGFQKGLKKRGADCQVFDVRDALRHPERYPERRLPAWLVRQPKPLALFCMADFQARELSQECAALGLKVPAEVAILGVDNDISCILGTPQLSSIEPSSQRIGYEAAQLLDELLTRGGAKRGIRVPPARVVIRTSTDPIVGTDEIARGVLEYMRQHLSDSQGIEQVCGRFGLSRRQLERRFVAATGCTPGQAWAGFRLEEAKRLLVETTLSMECIAKKSGYGDGKHFASSFKKATGLTPSRFRELMSNWNTSATSE